MASTSPASPTDAGAATGRTILHLSADYPDPVAPRKTRAIANLLELVPEHRHLVYSLNRTRWGSGIEAADFADAGGPEHRAVAYDAPPRGIFLKRCLDRLADWLAEDIARRGLRPDLVHAHKLSVEGIAGAALARRLGVPLALSLQGDSDLKIIGARPDLRPVWGRIWREAAVVFPFAPWTGERIAALLGPRDGPSRLLPCAGAADVTMTPRIVGPVFRSAFHFGVSRRKNAGGLIRAVGLAARAVPEIRLEIIGGGDERAAQRLADLAAKLAPGRIRFAGALPHEEMQAAFNASCGFALVSHRESFGMVFSEALLAGCPCLIPRGWGIDSYLAEGEAVVSAPSRDIDAIADGLVRLARDEAAFKARLARLAESGGLDLFRRGAIAATYRAGLAEALAATQPG